MSQHDALAARIDALNKRLNAILKDGDGASTAPASGPDASDVHVPSTEALKPKGKKKLKSKEAA